MKQIRTIGSQSYSAVCTSRMWDQCSNLDFMLNPPFSLNPLLFTPLPLCPPSLHPHPQTALFRWMQMGQVYSSSTQTAVPVLQPPFNLYTIIMEAMFAHHTLDHFSELWLFACVTRHWWFKGRVLAAGQKFWQDTREITLFCYR